MSGLVKCEICHKSFNPRYLASHKRMSHGHRAQHTAEPQASQHSHEVIREILAMYKQLSPEQQKLLLQQLQNLAE